jgi:hypothetical protein
MVVVAFVVCVASDFEWLDQSAKTPAPTKPAATSSAAPIHFPARDPPSVIAFPVMTGVASTMTGFDDDARFELGAPLGVGAAASVGAELMPGSMSGFERRDIGITATRPPMIEIGRPVIA